MKHRVLTAALLIAAVTACVSPEERFTVHGTVTDPLAAAPGSKVYLLGSGGWESPVDSAKVSDGKFSFNGTRDITAAYTAVLRYPGRKDSEDRFSASFIPDARVINIDLDYPATVTGSPLTDALDAFRDSVLETWFERESEIGDLVMNGLQAEADSLRRLQIRKVDDLCLFTYAGHQEDYVGLQAFTILAQDLSPEELAPLLAGCAPFILNDPTVREITESAKTE